MVVNSRDAAALRIATFHADCEEGVERAFRIFDEGQEADSVILLEINRETPPMGITPLVFPPWGEIPFRTIIVEITPDELGQLQAGELELPEGWSIGPEIFARI